MNKRSRLQSVVWALLRHLRRGELAQFIVDERKKLLGGIEIAALKRLQNVSDFAHLGSLTK